MRIIRTGLSANLNLSQQGVDEAIERFTPEQREKHLRQVNATVLKVRIPADLAEMLSVFLNR